MVHLKTYQKHTNTNGIELNQVLVIIIRPDGKITAILSLSGRCLVPWTVFCLRPENFPVTSFASSTQCTSRTHHFRSHFYWRKIVNEPCYAVRCRLPSPSNNRHEVKASSQLHPTKDHTQSNRLAHQIVSLLLYFRPVNDISLTISSKSK